MQVTRFKERKKERGREERSEREGKKKKKLLFDNFQKKLQVNLRATSSENIDKLIYPRLITVVMPTKQKCRDALTAGPVAFNCVN